MLREGQEQRFPGPHSCCPVPSRWCGWRPSNEEGHRGLSLPRGSGDPGAMELTARGAPARGWMLHIISLSCPFSDKEAVFPLHTASKEGPPVLATVGLQTR